VGRAAHYRRELVHPRRFTVTTREPDARPARGDVAERVFSYRAARADGSLEQGVLGAPNGEVARATLTARGLFPLAIATRDVEHIKRATTRLVPSDLSLGLRALATLLESGLPMTRVLATLQELAPSGWQAALPVMLQSVREGQGLAAALDAAPIAIPAVVLGIIRAGEAGSGQAAAVRRAADLADRSAARAAALRAALAYPLVLAAAGSASLMLLVGIVLPRFASILADLGQALPPTTRVVLVIGTIAHALALPVGVMTVVAIMTWHSWTSSPAGLLRWHSWLLSLPLVGAVRRAGATGRACEALASLLDSGVSVAPALTHAASATGDAAIAKRLHTARVAVIRGERLSAALHECDATTPTTVRLVRAGEEAGRLADMLHHAARIEAERSEATMQRIVRLLEPALILAFGGVIAFVAASPRHALYTLRPAG
jgi:general secretion pathway protein F